MNVNLLLVAAGITAPNRTKPICLARPA